MSASEDSKATGGMLQVKASQYALALLREGFELYESAMDPIVRSAAKKLWGEDKPEGQPVPRWVYKCKQLFGWSMKGFVTEDRGWDAYIIGTISMAHLKHFLPDGIRGEDAACEMHRCVYMACWEADRVCVQGSSASGGVSA